jgi:hypothetical protein
VKRAVLAVLACLAAAGAFAQDAQEQAAAAGPAAATEPASWNLGGTLTVEPTAAYGGTGSYNVSNFSYGSGSTLSLDLTAGSGRAKAEASAEAAVLTGSSAQVAWLIASSPYGRTDELLLPASSSAAAGEDAVIAARVRTLFVKLTYDWASFTAGRQVVNYGRGALWSPTDIFTELDLSGISPVRRGSDALRVVVPLGVTGGLDVVAAPTASPSSGRYAARLGGLIGEVVDAAVIAARDGAGKGWIAGADFKTDIVVGLYGDAIYVQPDSGNGGYVRAAAGADWSFGDFIVAAEYYYNGGGASADLLFPGTHNVYGSLTWTASELLQVSLAVTADVQNAAGTASLIARLSAAQNADVTAFLLAGNGTAGYGLGYGVSGAAWSAQAGAGIQVKF